MCYGVRLGGALPLVWAKAVPGALPPREMREELPGEQKANQQQNGSKKSFKEGSQKNILKVGEKYFFYLICGLQKVF